MLKGRDSNSKGTLVSAWTAAPTGISVRTSSTAGTPAIAEMTTTAGMLTTAETKAVQ